MSDSPRQPWADYSFVSLASLLVRMRLRRPAVELRDDEADDEASGQPDPSEFIRFRHDPSLCFPSGEISGLEWTKRKRGTRLEVTSTFFGLFGTVSPLPLHDTVAVLRNEEKDGALRDYFDVFHHRLYSLLLQASTKYRWHARYTGDDLISVGVLCLAGFGTGGLAETFERSSGLPATTLMRYAGLLAQRPRSRLVLTSLLRDHWAGVPVTMEEFIPVRIPLPDEDCTRLVSVDRRRGTQPFPPRRLGVDAVAGTHVVDVSSRMCVVLGPLDRRQFDRFLPGECGHDELRAFLAQAGPAHMEFEVDLILKAEDVPEFCLARGGSGRLGWTSWITSAESHKRRVKLGARRPARTAQRASSTAEEAAAVPVGT